MRFDGYRYRDCQWCAGRGCVYCKTEADKEYKRQFPDGPQPIATFDNTPEGIAAAKEAVGKDALDKAFGPEGGGIDEIMENIERVQKQKGDS